MSVALYEEGSVEPLISDLLSEDVTDEPTLEEDKTYILRIEAMPKNGLLLGAEPFIQELAFQIYPEAEPVIS